MIGIGNALDQFSHLNPEDWNNVDCLLNCGILEYAAKRDTIEAVWSRVPNVKWLHLASAGAYDKVKQQTWQRHCNRSRLRGAPLHAGIEHVVFPALIESDVVLTNARGCFSHSLAEFALFGCKYFALDFPRLQRAKNASSECMPLQSHSNRTPL